MPEDLQTYLDKLMHERNNRPVPEFEGYSPTEMHAILHLAFEESSPISFQKLEAADYRKIPLLNQIKYLAQLIEEAGEIKLTKLGFLPVDVVADIYAQRSEEHTSELQSRPHLVCRLLLEKKKKK